MTKVNVRLFARLADVVGARMVEMEIGEGLTAGDVFAVIAREHPGIAGLRVAFAVNQEYADAGQALVEGDEVALIPPVSGGAPRLSLRAERSAAEESGTSSVYTVGRTGMHFAVSDLSASSAAADYGRDDKGCCDVL